MVKLNFLIRKKNNSDVLHQLGILQNENKKLREEEMKLSDFKVQKLFEQRKHAIKTTPFLKQVKENKFKGGFFSLSFERNKYRI